MKVLCVTYDYKGPYSSFSVNKMLTIGEWYQVTDNYTHYTVYFTNDSFANLSKSYFRTVDEIRQQRLKSIGI